MKSKKLFVLTVTMIFFIIALVHLLRLINAWVVVIAGHTVPMSVSWMGMIITVLIACWGFWLFRRI